MIAFLRAALRPLKWRHFLALQVLGQFAILIESTEDTLFGTWLGHPSLHYASMALNVTLLVPLGLFADEFVTRGTRPRHAYTAAVLATYPVAFLSTTAMQWAYLQLFPLAPGTPNLFWRAALETSIHMCIYGSFVMLVYFNQRMADRILENFRAAELQRVTLERRLIESRVAATEAQIDPRRLFDDLATIRAEFAADSLTADDSLNTLIQSLRAALARTKPLEEPEVPRT